jgi:GTPase Era involved in 16S rRNA processing
MTANASATRTNVLVLGKSGVGKSSLLNYLFGAKVAAVGDGRPTTREVIHKHEPFSYNGISFVIYDSCGMEPGKAQIWKELIEKEVRENNDKEMRDWFHTVIYCVDAERARVEDFEVRDVLYPLLNGGNRILFALTKAGLDKTNTRETANVLQKEFADCDMVEVESVSAKLLEKPATTQQGRDELLNKICLNLWDNILNKSIEKYKRDMRAALYRRLTSETLNYFDEKAGPIGICTHYGEEFKNDVVKYIEQLTQSILTTTSDTLHMNIREGQVVASAVCIALDAGIKVPTQININASIKDSFPAWDNDCAAYLKAALNPIFRKSNMRDTIKKGCIEVVDIVEDFSDKLAESMRIELAAKKPIPQKNVLITAIREQNMFEVFQELKKNKNK